MAILKIARMGHPVLLLRAAAVVDPKAPEIAQLIENMAETLEDAGGVGLAAPQVHESLRLFIYKVPGARADEGEDEVPLSAVINPEITPLSDEITMGWEGCLSIPGLRAAVPRYERIRLSGYNAAGDAFASEISGFHARVVQHETDHLNGILYPMRMSDFRYFGFTEETMKYDFPLPKVQLQQEPVNE
ncbi:MAG: peptide deformylase [Acidocella sp. 20-57-95]|nr:MAG: peptide deformylase [Acidocella sp. 20-57-95]OYV59912.1 MAG: peptide deformylase [Acidocella sp. 21-58-7]HQT63063.1 peptide deformylase [Acidocella sp.]HQU04719.1 peptide deformylase [Acidocella sp.]